VNTILYVELLESQIMLNCLAHSYMSFVMWAFIGRRRSVARLKRDAPPKKVSTFFSFFYRVSGGKGGGGREGMKIEG